MKMMKAISEKNGDALGELIFDAECEKVTELLDMEYFEMTAFKLNNE